MFSESCILFPGGWSTRPKHALTKVITFVVADGHTYVNIDVVPQLDELKKKIKVLASGYELS